MGWEATSSEEPLSSPNHDHSEINPFDAKSDTGFSFGTKGIPFSKRIIFLRNLLCGIFGKGPLPIFIMQEIILNQLGWHH